MYLSETISKKSSLIPFDIIISIVFGIKNLFIIDPFMSLNQFNKLLYLIFIHFNSPIASVYFLEFILSTTYENEIESST